MSSPKEFDHDAWLAELYAHEFELEKAYDQMGKWKTHPRCAVASHPRRKQMSHAERHLLYQHRKPSGASNRRAVRGMKEIGKLLQPEDYDM